MNIGIALDPLYKLFRKEKSESIILNAIGQLQGAGVSNISFPLTYDLLEKYGEEWFIICRKAIQTHCTIRMPQEDDLVKMALKIKPDMIIFGDIMNTENPGLSPIDPQLQQDWLSDVKLTLEANSISLGILIDPKPKSMKHVQKIKPDWLELSGDHLLQSVDSNDLLLKTEDYSNVCLMASKLGMGVTLNGDFSLTDLHLPHEIQNISELVLNDSFWELCTIYGIDKTLEMVRFHLRR